MIRNIQALRALAVFLVVLEHSLPTLALGGIETAGLSFGHAGVDIFFVISGFIMVVTTDTRETHAGDFLWRRIVRIVPIYWLLTFVVFAIALIAPSLMQATSANPIALVKSLFFVPFVKSNGLVQPVVFVGWTLNYEMFFYALFAVSLLIPNRPVRLSLMIGSLVFLAIAGLCFPAENVGYTFYTDPIMLEFGAGILLGACWSRFPNGNNWWSVAAVIGLAAGGILIGLRPALWPEIHRAISFGIPAFLLVGSALLLEKAGRVVTANWILLLGLASYSIYLTHFFVTQLAKKIAGSVHLHTGMTAVAMVLASALMVAIVGIIVHRWIELPLTELAKNGGRRRAEQVA